MRRYLLGLTLATLVLLAAVAGLARLIDPYGYWGTPIIRGLNEAKPFALQHQIPVKQALYRRLEPRTVLVGNSRVEVGLDPLSRQWPSAMQPVYNFGMPSQSLKVSVAAMIAALHSHKPDTILLGLDYFDFRVTAREWQAVVPAPEDRAYRTPLTDRVQMLLSLDALTDSLLAIAEQHRAWPATTTPQGFNGLSDYNRIVAAEGHAALFEKRNIENIGRLLHPEKRLRWPGAGANAEWQALSRLRTVCRQRGIRLVLFTYPYHGDLLLGIARAGRWRELMTWRSELAQFAAAADLPLHDFTVIDATTTEPVPVAGDTRTRMAWYWEGGHYKAALGDRMIAAVLSGQAPHLTAGNVAARNTGLTAALRAHEIQDQAAVARIDQQARQAGLP